MLQFRLPLICSASMSMSLSYIYNNIRVVTNADDTVRSTLSVTVTHFKINDVLLYMHFICVILANFSFSWVICIVFFFTIVVVIRSLFQAHIVFALVLNKMSGKAHAETLADGLNTCCPPPRKETIWMSMLHKFAAAYNVI